MIESRSDLITRMVVTYALSEKQAHLVADFILEERKKIREIYKNGHDEEFYNV